MRQRTCRDAHPPRENLIFQEKCRKGVPKSMRNRSWDSLGAPKSTPEALEGPRHGPRACFCDFGGTPGALLGGVFDKKLMLKLAESLPLVSK